MTNYFITGASGFIGRHLTQALLKEGGKVFIIVRPRAEVAELKKNGAVVFRGDFTRLADLEKFFSGQKNDQKIGVKVDIVFHLAAMVKEAGVPDSLFYQVNVKGTKNILEAARKFDVKRVVYCSTTGVLGDVQKVPASADDPYRPVDIYQKTKTEAELAALEASTKAPPEVVIVRPGAVYGPGDRRFLKLFKMINRRLFAMLGAGKNFLHPVYIDDLIEGLKLCASVSGINGRIYQLAGKRYVTVKEWTDSIAAALGKKIWPFKLPLWPVLVAADIFEWLGKTFRFEPPIFRRRMEFFVKNRAFDTSGAERDLGYAPKTALTEGLAQTVKWYREKNWL